MLLQLGFIYACSQAIMRQKAIALRADTLQASTQRARYRGTSTIEQVPDEQHII
jgi:hypothetical protein